MLWLNRKNVGKTVETRKSFKLVKQEYSGYLKICFSSQKIKKYVKNWKKYDYLKFVAIARNPLDFQTKLKAFDTCKNLLIF